MQTLPTIDQRPQSQQRISPWVDVLLLILFAGSLYLSNLGGARLWDIDEPRNAGCALEMMQRGDWVTPMFNGEMRGQKPVLVYWLIMSAYKVFGVTEFAARFWSAILGTGTVVCTYLMGRRLYGRTGGLWSAIVLSTTLMFTVASRAATPDAPLIFFSTLAITCYVMLTFAPTSDQTVTRWEQRLRVSGRWFPSQGRTLPIYCAMAVGVLAKGPIAAVLPCCIIGLFIMIADSVSEKQRTCGGTKNRNSLARITVNIWSALNPRRFLIALWRMQPWWLVFTIALIAAPWFIWVGIRTEGDFLRWFFFQEHFGRATTAMENHSGGPWFYPVAILIGFFPWSILAVPFAIGAYRQLSDKSDPAIKIGMTLGLVWLCLQVTVFTLVSTKLPSYVTPCYPAIALICGPLLAGLANGKLFCWPNLIRGGYAALGIVGAALLIGLPLITDQFELQGGWLGWIGIIPIVAATSAAILSYRGDFRRTPTVLAVSSWAFIFLFFSIGTSAIDQNRETEQLWAARQIEDGDVKIASYRYLESSWVFYSGHTIWELSPQARLPAKEIELPVENVPAVQSSAGRSQVDSSVVLADFQQALAPSSDGSSDGSATENNNLQAIDPLQQKQAWHTKPNPSPTQLINAYPDSVILVSDQHLEELLKMLPEGYGELKRCRKFLKPGHLVLVGKLSNAKQATSK